MDGGVGIFSDIAQSTTNSESVVRELTDRSLMLSLSTATVTQHNAQTSTTTNPTSNNSGGNRVPIFQVDEADEMSRQRESENASLRRQLTELQSVRGSAFFLLLFSLLCLCLP